MDINLGTLLKEWEKRASKLTLADSLEERHSWEAQFAKTVPLVGAEIEEGHWHCLVDYLVSLRALLPSTNGNLKETLEVRQLRIYAFDLLESQIFVGKAAKLGVLVSHLRKLAVIACFLETPSLLEIYSRTAPRGTADSCASFSEFLTVLWATVTQDTQESDIRGIHSVLRLFGRIFQKDVQERGITQFQRECAEFEKAERCQENKLWGGSTWEGDRMWLLGRYYSCWESALLTGPIDGYYQGASVPIDVLAKALGGDKAERVLKYWDATGAPFWKGSLRLQCGFDFLPCRFTSEEDVLGSLAVSIGLDVNILVAGEPDAGKSSFLFGLRQLGLAEIRQDPSIDDENTPTPPHLEKLTEIWEKGGPRPDEEVERWRTQFRDLYGRTSKEGVRFCFFDLAGELLKDAAKGDSNRQVELARYLEQNQPRALVFIFKPSPEGTNGGVPEWDVPDYLINHLCSIIPEAKKLPVFVALNQTDEVLRRYGGNGALIQELTHQLIEKPAFTSGPDPWTVFPFHGLDGHRGHNEILAASPSLQHRLALDFPKLQNMRDKFAKVYVGYTQASYELLIEVDEASGVRHPLTVSPDQRRDMYVRAARLWEDRNPPGSEERRKSLRKAADAWQNHRSESLKQLWSRLHDVVEGATRHSARTWIQTNIINFLIKQEEETRSFLDAFDGAIVAAKRQFGELKLPAGKVDPFKNLASCFKAPVGDDLNVAIKNDAQNLGGTITWEAIVNGGGGANFGDQLREIFADWKKALSNADTQVKVLIDRCRAYAGCGDSSPVSDWNNLLYLLGEPAPRLLSEVLAEYWLEDSKDKLLLPRVGVLLTGVSTWDAEPESKWLVECHAEDQGDAGMRRSKTTMWPPFGNDPTRRRSNWADSPSAWWHNFVFDRYSQDFDRYKALRRWHPKGITVAFSSVQPKAGVTLDFCDEWILTKLLPKLRKIKREIEQSTKNLEKLERKAMAAYILRILAELGVRIELLSEGAEKFAKKLSEAEGVCRDPFPDGKFVSRIFRQIDFEKVSPKIEAIMVGAHGRNEETFERIGSALLKVGAAKSLDSKSLEGFLRTYVDFLSKEDIDSIGAKKTEALFPTVLASPYSRGYAVDDGEVYWKFPAWEEIYNEAKQYTELADQLSLNERWEFWAKAGWEHRRRDPQSPNPGEVAARPQPALRKAWIENVGEFVNRVFGKKEPGAGTP